MCRIAGIYNPRSVQLKQEIIAMRDAMRHGGPDDEGIYIDDEFPLALGHRRLSLIDLSSGGHQPMSEESGRLQIIFNGEIYNYKEVKETLKSAGYNFRSLSDTEVILKAYLHWGTDCFEFFNGMFALAILDKEKKQLILARDHAGIKPLYYYLDEHSLYFSSEIRAFQYAAFEFEHNPDWKYFFLAFGHLPEPVTTLKNVVPMEKGQLLIIDLPSLRVHHKTFNEFSFAGSLQSEEEAIQLMKLTLNESVRRHLISDAPIGLFLSGGIDSSLLTLIAQAYVPDHLHTLSIVFDEEEYTEKEFQSLIVKKTGAQHQSFLVTQKEFNSKMEDVMHAMDQPTVDGINSYFISKYAHEYGLKAVLSGLGADELFGGYPSFQFADRYKIISQLPSAFLKLLNYMPGDRFKKLSFASRKDLVGEYLVYRGLFNVNKIASILGTTESDVERHLDILQLPAFVNDLKNGNRVSYLETNYYMQNQLLKDTDFMSMWHGLEIRVPFLDRELMDLVFKISGQVKFSKPVAKYLLIEAYKDELPEKIWNRKKQGFTFPFNKWMLTASHTQPQSVDEQKYFRDFKKGKLSWGRYWCTLIANRFEHSFAYAA